MQKQMQKGIIIGIIVAVFIIISVVSYNGLAACRETVDEKASIIDVQLARRGDLVGNLVESVKGYAAHETEIFTAVSEARAKLAGAATTEEKSAANDETTGALSRLLAVTEAYPDLKADTNFRQLSDELAGTENRIAVARIDFNNAVAEYNKKIVALPGVIFARLMGWEKLAYFEAPEASKESPRISF